MEGKERGRKKKWKSFTLTHVNWYVCQMNECMNGTRAHKAWKFINNKEYILSMFEVMRHVCKYVSSRMYDWGIALWYDIENVCIYELEE